MIARQNMDAHPARDAARLPGAPASPGGVRTAAQRSAVRTLILARMDRVAA